MTIHDDRNVNRNRDLNRNTEWGMSHYILGGLATLAVIFGLMFMLSDKNSNVANRTDRPAVTTGSGPVTTPTTSPAQPRAVEAPAQTPTTTTGSGSAR